MQSIKCPQCGLVLLAGSPVCKSCGAPLQDRRAEQPTSAYQVGSFDRQQGQSETQSRLPFLSLILGWLLLAFGNKYGLMIWPIALVAFLIGVVTSVISIFARKRSRNPQTRLWPAVTALVVNSVLVLNCAIVIPTIALSSYVKSARAPHWREYVSADGGFTIQMPDEPEVKYDRLNTPAGPVPMHGVFANLPGNGSCTSIYFDYSGYQLRMTADEFLDNGVNMFLKNFDSTLVSKTEIFIDGYKGVEIESTPNSSSGSSPLRATTRIYWLPDKKFIYLNHVVGVESGAVYRERLTFLDSFHFTPQP